MCISHGSKTRGRPTLCGDQTVNEHAGMVDRGHSRSRTGDGTVLGWLSGLGIVVIPWIASGIVSTFLPEPEASFPWVFLAAFVAMIGWIAYGSSRIPRFRRGAILGSVISLGVFGLIYALLLLAQP